jgi:hypothetical protein
MADEGHGQKLSRNHERAIAALLSAPTIAEAAKAAGIGEATLGRWLKDERFATAYRDARRAVLSVAMNRIQRAIDKAVSTLEAVMDDTQAPASARVSAARSVLEMSAKTIELDDLAARVAEIERSLPTKKGR